MAGKGEGPQTEEKTGKRGHYKKVECPHCHKMVGNLKNHILQKHPVEEQAPALVKEVLTGEKKPSEVELQPESIIYYCKDCHAALRRGETHCWRCFKALNWEGID